MRHARLTALCASLLTLSAASPGEQVPESESVRDAPEVKTPDAPPEAALEPQPESEKAQAAPGVVEIRNPAFPGPPPPQPVVHRGRRYAASDLSPYFAEGVLAEAAPRQQDLGLRRQGPVRDLAVLHGVEGLERKDVITLGDAQGPGAEQPAAPGELRHAGGRGDLRARGRTRQGFQHEPGNGDGT